jgi:hypothetical protein
MSRHFKVWVSVWLLSSLVVVVLSAIDLPAALVIDTTPGNQDIADFGESATPS